MTPFEEELKKALARHELGDDFTAQVLARTGTRRQPSEPPTKLTGFRLWFASGRGAWRFAALAALCVLLISGTAYRQHLQTVKGQLAKQQLLTAMRVAGTQLHQAQLRVRRIESPEVVMQ